LLQIAPVNQWTKICIVFDNGVFTIYWNGLPHFGQGITFDTLPFRFAPNTHSATTLGFKPDFDSFHGYIDDVSKGLHTLLLYIQYIDEMLD